MQAMSGLCIMQITFMKCILEEQKTGCSLSAFYFVFICAGFKKSNITLKKRNTIPLLLGFHLMLLLVFCSYPQCKVNH